MSESKFADIHDVVDGLSLPDQETLVFLVQKRLSQARRKIHAQEIHSARLEFEQGKCNPSTVEELMRNIIE
jgi:hypothetical protein